MLPELFQREQIRGVLAIIEDKARGGINRHGTGVGGWIGLLSGVQSERGEAEFGFFSGMTTDHSSLRPCNVQQQIIESSVSSAGTAERPGRNRWPSRSPS